MAIISSLRRAGRHYGAMWVGAFSSVVLLPTLARPDPPDTAKGRPLLLKSAEIPTTPAPPCLDADTRLAVGVTAEAKSAALADCLPLLTPPNLTVRPSPQIAQRRVSVFAEKATLRQLMSAVADTLDLSWRMDDKPDQKQGMQNTAGPDKITRRPPGDYILFQFDEAYKRERKQIADSEAWNTGAHDARRDAMAAAIREALNPPADDKHSPDPMNGLLATLSPEQVDQACELATQPMGVIAADNNRNLLPNLVGVRAFADLTPAQQSQARALLGRPPSSSGGAGKSNSASGASSGDDLSRSSVGFVAMEGAISLAVVAPDGSDVALAGSAVHSRTVPGLASDDDSDPEINALAQKVTLLDLSGVPKMIRAKRLRFGRDLDHGDLPALLQSLARQTGLAIVADDFVRSRRTVYYWLLTDKDDYTLDEACGQLARAFGHRMVYKNGVLRVQTVSPGPDLRVEPPADVLARLHDLTAKHLLPTLADYVMLGQLTRPQMDVLTAARLPGITQGMLLVGAQQAYSLLHFYALLPPALRERAAGPAGLPLSALDARQTEAFAALGQQGARRSFAVKDAALVGRTHTPGLYARSEQYEDKYGRGKRTRWTLAIVPDRQAARIISYTIEP